MSDTLIRTETKPGGGGRDISHDDFGGFGGGGGDGGGEGSFETARVGLWVLMGSLTMLFAAFTSAYLVRRTASDWSPIQVPSILWLNTMVLLASSATMELARSSFRQWRPLAFRKWLLATFVLGALFLAGQVLAWRELAAQGVYLDSNPHSSFFYVLTGVHGVHLLAGIIALFYALSQSLHYRLTPGESHAPSLCATYWHFVDGLWIYVFAVLFLW